MERVLGSHRSSRLKQRVEHASHTLSTLLYPVLVLPPSLEKGTQIWNVILDNSGYWASFGLAHHPGWVSQHKVRREGVGQAEQGGDKNLWRQTWKSRPSRFNTGLRVHLKANDTADCPVGIPSLSYLSWQESTMTAISRNSIVYRTLPGQATSQLALNKDYCC